MKVPEPSSKRKKKSDKGVTKGVVRCPIIQGASSD